VIREELFSAERLEEHARSLAGAQPVRPQPDKGRPLAGRLANNGVVLLAAYRTIIKAIDEGRAITPAAEWLIDNYHLVERQVREIRSDLPPGYYRELPKLAEGPFVGYPRVFGIAWAFVAHTDSRYDGDLLLRYMRAYQEVQPLTIGELWALSITLRIVLVENLRRLAQQIVDNRAARQRADLLADRLLGLGGDVAEPAAAVFAGYETGPLSEPFAVQLLHRLRDQDPRITPALTWLDRRLDEQGATADSVVRDVHRRQGASNVTVRNVITSIRMITEVDWTLNFEDISLVDVELASGSAFGDMDFPTRNLYRSAIEELARGSGRTEIDVARAAVAAGQRHRGATNAAALDVAEIDAAAIDIAAIEVAAVDLSAVEEPAVDAAVDPRQSDPGYHLIAGGYDAFAAALGYRRPLRRWPIGVNRALGISGYVAGSAVLAAMLLAIPVIALVAAGVPTGLLVLLALLGAVPAIDAAVALANRFVAVGIGAKPLPALELRDGIPETLRTLVAVPTMLTTVAAIAEQIERLEVHYLASPEGDLHFALLSDFTDATTEHVAGDGALLAAAAAGIARLNRRHGAAAGGARFFLFHRRRVWSESEGRWIGWERKRGKLHELNQLLRGAGATTFLDVDGRPPLPPIGVRYVVTLDSDTRLPRDTVRRLIGKMAHPLNRPRFDAPAGRVVEGYAVLQPRVTPSLPVGREGSLFQRIFSSLSGIDPYAAAVSDVYQDLFGEGSYAGKGIYDVDAFEASLAGRVPDGTLLSHDLFEGAFARAGLASDVEVVEEFPARYDVGALRHHRWARGDWQLLPWIFGRGPLPAGGDRARGEVPRIGRWKMLDNLRRTVSAPAAVTALIAGLLLPVEAAVMWTVFVLSTIILPTLIPLVAAIVPRRSGITIASHTRAFSSDLTLALSLSALIIVFLAHQAWLMGDAIVRTLWRLFVSRRHLLEWVPAAQVASGPGLGLSGTYRRMAGALVIAVAALLVAWLSGQGTWVLAVPLATLWALSPAVAVWVSRAPHAAGQVAVSDADARALRQTARRTWRFFETFVTADDRWLPPDNFQETPVPIVAHRTSPTNIGLYLLSVASAHDFGWIGTTEAAERLERTLATLAEMEHFRGHLYNWYDTGDLRPLDPRYVSSVDSGNLAGHLIALANALRQWRTSPASPTPLAGIVDALELTRLQVTAQQDGRRTQTVTLPQIEAALAALATAVARAPDVDNAVVAGRLAALSVEAETLVDITNALAIERGDDSGTDMVFWARAVLASILSQHRDLSMPASDATALEARLATLEATARAMALATEFGFLLDPDRHLLSIGYLVPEAMLDANCYDLLASEARLASFLAIAKGDVPARHWFSLGRSVTPVAHGAALISWSGSMFEYLMPSLVMRAPTGSLLEQTSRLIVRRQIDYGAALRLPWGISESAYNARDIEYTYQYSNFGVPGLGLKRGLGENRVVAPYASALAAMVDPRAAVLNFGRLAAAGACGRYGFYEALDYTPSRVPEGEAVAIVRSFMAHHQGMSIVAIADAIFGGRMRARFHAEPAVQATELLLQERPPRDVSVAQPWEVETSAVARIQEPQPSGERRFTHAAQPTPATLLLSNGRYTSLVTAAGSGFSRWGNLAITRWREDATCDDFGSYVFLRDVRSGAIWSAGAQPIGAESDRYSVVFNEDRAVFARQDGTLTTTMEVVVSSEDDAEVRRISISNAGGRTREVEVTSYAELVLAPQASDVAHPAFSKLFVETEYLPAVGAVLATRRRRAPSEPEVWAAHLSVVDGPVVGRPEIETDRARFLGRGNGIHSPIAMIDDRPLSNTVGTVLDPIFAMRRRVRVAPGATVRIDFWTVIASSRAAVLDLVDQHRDITAFGRAGTLAWTQAQVQLHHLGIDAGDAGLFQTLAGHVVYAAPAMRPSSDTILRGAGAQPGLWGQGLSGDLPIVLVRISDMEGLSFVRQLLQAHEYFRMKQLAVDLVILNERASSYVQDLQVALESAVRTSQSRPRTSGGPPGSVVVLRADLIAAETRSLLAAVARVVLVAQRGSLVDQINRVAANNGPVRTIAASISREEGPLPPTALPIMEFFNGLGGFADSGREYVTILGPGQSTPAPWINVVSNPAFGFQVATEGSGYTWSVNSRENQLTPWSNDPVADRPGEVIYLHDDETGDLWGPTALPIRDERATYLARHGRGYSRFEHTRHGIAANLLQFVPLEAPVKISRLTLRNQSARPRRISVTAYVEWVLGASRSATLPYVTTEIDAATGAMFARNPWSAAFGSRVAFVELGGRQRDFTGDRRAFIGRNGSLARPAALTSGARLSGIVGAGLDPCGAMRTTLEIPAHGRVEIVVLLGEAADADEARSLIARYRSANLDGVLAEIGRHWDDVLGAVQVKTPDRPMDIMLNGWLLYQTIACRVWARSAFYQASGAYGFRDQLQDGMAIAGTRPAMARAHLLRAAARQFIEGDVQHWWLPHSGQGVRTRISDDRAWLAFTVAHHVVATGDAGVLDEVVPFLEGQQLEAGEHDAFFLPTIADETASLYEHCARALDHSLAVGAHGLPLIGTGDWNDGMNRVGEAGRGESVWLGWFLHAALAAFAPFAEARGETQRAATWRTHMVALRTAIEREAWDGDWYRRGFFDDGTPLGSAMSEECRIDSIAQSWAVLSGAADPARAGLAMASLDRELIRHRDGLALLFTPPFDKTALDPGYIKGYPPGVRENGGQYTHAATWSVTAFAARGDGDRAAGLFSLLNPINHARRRSDVFRYKVEPYVVAADVYSDGPHVGRGGWTWYTGSAGWMQRAGIEAILGLRLEGAVLRLDPCIPKTWPGFEMTVRHGSARYRIVVDNPDGTGSGIRTATLDGAVVDARPLRLTLVDDGGAHEVQVRLG
jgi:cyclic beta-1,2-glucan synthetase